jgi:myo-inositol 2-dehydrogenase / D-chiro-inositol 1-dehydrogenase
VFVKPDQTIVHIWKAAMMPQTLGVGFLGAGPVTQAIHLPTLARMTDRYTVTHVNDVDADVAASVAGRVGARSSTSMEDLLADPAVDIVAICSPHRFHAAQVIAACRAGKRAVLCEKPFAMSGAEATEIADVARETGVPIVVGAMHTFDPGWRAATEAWGDLPDTTHTIRSSIVLPPNPRFEDFATEVVARPPSSAPDTADVEVRAGMVHGGVMGLAIHDLPLIRALLPRFDDLQVHRAVPLAPFGYRILATAGGRRIELHAAMTATWQPSWIFEAYADDQILTTEFSPSYVHAGSAVSTLRAPDSSRTFGPWTANGYEGEWSEIDDIVRGRAPAPDLAVVIDDLRFALAVADAAADSVRTTQAGKVAA